MMSTLSGMTVVALSGMHPIAMDWSVAMVVGLCACMLIALIQEMVSFLQRRQR